MEYQIKKNFIGEMSGAAQSFLLKPVFHDGFRRERLAGWGVFAAS
ncbi:hypothetical protein [Ralstonia syzygii]|nr:hypothetical protein [Ralstonia syzygii]